MCEKYELQVPNIMITVNRTVCRRQVDINNFLQDNHVSCRFHIKFMSLLYTYLLIYNMEQSPSWEANRFSASQENPRILLNPKVHYHIRNSPPSLAWASSIQSMPPHHTSWKSILILSSHLSQGLPSDLFPSGFPTKTLYTPLLSPYALHAPPSH
jgi:hypothetical protein